MKNQWIIGCVLTSFLLVFITVKMDCKSIENNIISLKMKKRIIEDNLKVLRSKENILSSKNRIEKIAIQELGMYSPPPESLVIEIR